MQARSLLCRPADTPLRRDLQKRYGRGSLAVEGGCCPLLSAASSPWNTLLIFLHGGGYLGGITGLHWMFLQSLLKDFSGLAAVPLYPLTCAAEVFPFLEGCMRRLEETVRPKRLLFLGDSAGAGLALSLAQLLEEQKKRGPEKIVLLSPCLCLDGSVPGGEDLLPLKQVQTQWANGLPLRHPWVSPLYGDFAGIGEITVYTGTADPLYPQALALRKRGTEARCRVTVTETPGAGHDFLLLSPWREEKRLRFDT